MKFLLLFAIGVAWGCLAAWYVGPENFNLFNYIIGFIVIPGAIGILFAKAEQLLVKK